MKWIFLLVLLVIGCAGIEVSESLEPVKSIMPTKSKVSIDYSCEVDEDCEIKDVGNCCGYYPECMNKRSVTDPEAVKRECEKEGMMSICGFPSIDSCKCESNKCVAVGPSGNLA